MRLASISISAGLLALVAADNTLDLYQSFPKTANGHALYRRQQSKNPFSIQGLLGGGMQKAGPVKRVELQPSGKRSGAKRTKIYFGPHTLPKKGVKSPREFIIQFDPYSKTWMQPVGFPSDITILFSNHYLEYEDGTRANATNGVYSHHTFYMDLTRGWKSAWTCPGVGGALYPQITLMGVMNNQGEDSYLTTYTSPDGKLNSGYYVKKDDYVVSSGEVINYNNEDKKVYVVADIEYLPGRQPDFYEADIQALFISGCDWKNIGGAMNLKLPQGAKKHTFKSRDMMFAEDGYLVNLIGHLHDGGINIVLKLKNQTICDSKAIYGKADGHSHGMMGMSGGNSEASPPAMAGHGVGGNGEYQGIIGMTSCDTPIKVSKGDIYTIEATIDFEQRPPRAQAQGKSAEVMGMFAAMFASKRK